MSNDCYPFKEPGQAFTAKATAAVTGKRFLKLSGSRTDGPGVPANNLPGTALGGIYQVATADLLSRIVGVAAYDAAINADVKVLRGSGLIVPVTLETDVAFFQEVCVGATGQARAMVAAFRNTGVVGNNNAITWTANRSGTQGNGITTSIVVAGANTPLTVVVNGNDIVVNAATNGASAATSTAADIITAVNASTDAAALVTASNQGASNGTGVVAAVAVGDLTGGAGLNPVGYAMTAGTATNDGEICLY